MNYRLEKDSCGSLEVDENAFYGIQSLRAKNNFNITGNKMHPAFIDSIVLIKKSASIVNGENNLLPKEKADAIIFACDEILSGKYRDEFICDAIQGGAGTSANMNVNEVVANVAIKHLNGKLGDYSIISPNDHVNMEQSTNDVIPSAGKLTVIKLSKDLIKELNNLYDALLNKAKEFDGILKMGRTQLQDAVPMRYGQSFSAYATSVKRDINRIQKALNEMYYLNLGGTAIGTAINVKKPYFENVIPTLSKLFNEQLYRCEDLFDGTQNIDSFVNVSSSLKTCAVNLSKMCNDLRLLASGPKTGISELKLPAKQNGSSIMPGKVNPVIPEVVNQVAFLVIGHDTTITMAAEAGQLELNAFEPVVFYQLFESITALTSAIKTLTENCINGIEVNKERCNDLVNSSVGIVTALNPYIGYVNAANIAKESLKTEESIKSIVLRNKLLDEDTLNKVLDPFKLTTPLL